MSKRSSAVGQMGAWALAAVVLSAGSAGIALAKEPAGGAETAAIEAALSKCVAKYQELEAHHASGEELARHFFWPEAVATGEGFPTAARGMAALAAMAEAGRTGPCKESRRDPIIHSGNLATEFTVFTCEAGEGSPAQQARVLSVWQRRGKTWKVIREHWSSGTLD